MIDTDKYEGHDYNWYVKRFGGKHEVRVDGKNEVEDDLVCCLQYHAAFKYEQAKNAKLIADAPLLLAEVKRLREGIERLVNEGSPDRIWVHNTDLRELIK